MLVLTEDNHIIVFRISNNEIAMCENQPDLNIGTHKVLKMENEKVKGVVTLTCLQKNSSSKNIYQVRLRKHLLNKNWVLI